MSDPLIRRRTLPGSLRYLAQRLADPCTDADQLAVAHTLAQLADREEAEREEQRLAHVETLEASHATIVRYRERAEKAEAAVARARAVADRWTRFGTADVWRYAQILSDELDRDSDEGAIV
jgi:hypothetical protein